MTPYFAPPLPGERVILNAFVSRPSTEPISLSQCLGGGVTEMTDRTSKTELRICVEVFFSDVALMIVLDPNSWPIGAEMMESAPTVLGLNPGSMSNNPIPIRMLSLAEPAREGSNEGNQSCDEYQLSQAAAEAPERHSHVVWAAADIRPPRSIMRMWSRPKPPAAKPVSPSSEGSCRLRRLQGRHCCLDARPRRAGEYPRMQCRLYADAAQDNPGVMARRDRARPDRQYLLVQWSAGSARSDQLRRRQSRHSRFYEGAGAQDAIEPRRTWGD